MVVSSVKHAHRHWGVIVAAVSLALLLGTVGALIARSQAQSRSQAVANFKLRGSASATLVSTYLAQQASRERQSAEQLMSLPDVTRSRFRTVTTAFGAQSAVLLDSNGVTLNVTPSRAGRVGQSLSAYPTTRQAEQDETAVSDVLPGPSGLPSIVTVAVPFQSVLFGRRVFAASYTVGSPQLIGFVDHAISNPQHQVLLIDGRGTLLAASPSTMATSIWGADLPLAQALARHSTGDVPGAPVPSTFTVAPISGTPWRIVLMTPDSQLFATTSGTAELIPWLVFALLSVLGVLLLLVFARSLADRARLSLLSSELEAIARTDPLTGLLNRRGIEEDLARTFARTHRRGEPMTVLMLDLDRFKEVNDRYGHEAGDRVLVTVADCLRETLRAEDIFGRIGGDEFLVLMTGAEAGAGRVAAGRLQAATGAVDLTELGLPNGIAISVGLACGLNMTPEDLIRAADVDLYRVKDARRAGAQDAPAATGR